MMNHGSRRRGLAGPVCTKVMMAGIGFWAGCVRAAGVLGSRCAQLLPWAGRQELRRGANCLRKLRAHANTKTHV